MYNKKNYLMKMRNRIFPIYISQMKLNNDVTKEKYYHVILNTVPRNISNEELKYLLKYKKFVECNVYSMADPSEINQTEKLLMHVIKNNIIGSVLEMGVWRGGMCMWIQAIFKHCNSYRDLYLFDTFGSFPKSNYNKDSYIHDITNLLFENPHSVDAVIDNFRKMNLLNKNMNFIVGEFKDTVPETNLDSIALLRCDADYYDSTIIILENYYWKITKNGFIIIDDYNNKFLGCKNAVDEFREKYHISNKIIDEYGGSVYWQV